MFKLLKSIFRVNVKQKFVRNKTSELYCKLIMGGMTHEEAIKEIDLKIVEPMILELKHIKGESEIEEI